MKRIDTDKCNATLVTVASLFALSSIGACASTPDRQAERDPPAAADEVAAVVPPAVEDEADCNIGMTVCWTPGSTRTTKPPTTTKVTVQPDVPVIKGTSCAPGEFCQHVRIEAVGTGDHYWDAAQTLAGLVCTLDIDGLKGSSPGYYRGRLNDCSNGESYGFKYVKVQRVDPL